VGNSFTADIPGLSSGTSYEFQAVAPTSNDSDDGGVQSLDTDSIGDSGCFITTATAGETETLESLCRSRYDPMR
jgi:hypothetical protein